MFDDKVVITAPEPLAVPIGGYKQQQRINLVFRNAGKVTLVVTEMPVYLMNEAGKTIEAHHPLRK